MKDGIYSVKVNFGGRLVLAKGEVRNGVFRGLGSIAHLTGVFASPAPVPESFSTPQHRSLSQVNGEVALLRDALQRTCGATGASEHAVQRARHRSLLVASTEACRQSIEARRACHDLAADAWSRLRRSNRFSS